MADPDIEQRMKLDMLMAELQRAPGAAQLFEAIKERQDEVQRKILRAPDLGTDLAGLYHLIGQFTAFGVVLGLPKTLTNEAAKLREEQQQAPKRARRDPIVTTARRA